MSGLGSTADGSDGSLERITDDPAARTAELRELRPSGGAVDRSAPVFGVLGNGDRLRVLEALGGSERRGCELRVVSDLPKPTVATRLRRLEEEGIPTSGRADTWSHNRTADTAVSDLLDHARAIPEGV